MVPGTDSPSTPDAGLGLSWSGRLSLTSRILAVNVFAIAILAGSFFYLDSFRARLVDERLTQAAAEVRLMAGVLERSNSAEWPAVISTLGSDSHARIRIVDAAGRVRHDSLALVGPAFQLRDPTREPWQRKIALRMDRVIDWIVDADLPPPYDANALGIDPVRRKSAISFAPDRTHLIAAAATIRGTETTITTLRAARDIRRLVRAERSRLGLIIGLTITMSVLLSLFLARTIVRPLQKLADAAVQVRLGQAREVTVPRLPFRRDEIGTLARALSDMTHALRQRIDATEAFAADVAHELKNPLASMASAVQTMDSVKDEHLRKQLYDVISDDVRRLDRLITDIAELSRIDGQLARTRFAPVDLGATISGILKLRKDRGRDGTVSIAFARPATRSTSVLGDERRLATVVENLLDNAVSFSPTDGLVRISATRDGDLVRVSVDDDGPGIPANARAAVFERFHSDRPESHEFGKHSGLGLAICRAIIEAHGGEIQALGREDGAPGARLEFSLPAQGKR